MGIGPCRAMAPQEAGEASRVSSCGRRVGCVAVVGRSLRDGAHLGTEVSPRLPHVVIGLHRVPATRRRAEGLREPKVHVRAHSRGAIEYTRESYARHAQPLGRLGDADLGKPLAQDFPRVLWASSAGPASIFHAKEFERFSRVASCGDASSPRFMGARSPPVMAKRAYLQSPVIPTSRHIRARLGRGT